MLVVSLPAFIRPRGKLELGRPLGHVDRGRAEKLQRAVVDHGADLLRRLKDRHRQWDRLLERGVAFQQLRVALAKGLAHAQRDGAQRELAGGGVGRLGELGRLRAGGVEDFLTEIPQRVLPQIERDVFIGIAQQLPMQVFPRWVRAGFF